jgi:calcium-dependent protein kinase
MDPDTLNGNSGTYELNGVAPSTHFALGTPLGFPGSFGEVFSCTDKRTGKACAIKVIKVRECMMKAVRTETSILKELDHVNIAKCLAIYNERHQVSIVMEKCSGGDLFDSIQQKRFKTESQIIELVRQIVLGIQHIHSHKIVHCDVKLANILLTDNSQHPTVKIIDFGVSQYLKGTAPLSAEVGSPSFMAPEVLDGCYDQAADLWSLGVVVFILLFGFNPFNPRARSAVKYRNKICGAIHAGFCNETKKGYGAFFPESIPASDTAKDFVAKLLDSDASSRMSCDAALDHPWLAHWDSDSE